MDHTAPAGRGRPTAPAVMTPLQATLELARRGDPRVLPQLRKALDEHPEVWRQFGDLARHAEQAWVDRIADRDLLIGQSVRRQVEHMRAELAGPAPAALDKLLVDRVVVSWLAAQHAELAEAIAPAADAGQVAALRLKRAESANRRLLAAAKTLAQVRRLAKGISIEIRHEQAAGPVAGSRSATGGGGRFGALLADRDGLPATDLDAVEA